MEDGWSDIEGGDLGLEVGGHGREVASRPARAHGEASIVGRCADGFGRQNSKAETRVVVKGTEFEEARRSRDAVRPEAWRRRWEQEEGWKEDIRRLVRGACVLESRLFRWDARGRGRGLGLDS